MKIILIAFLSVFAAMAQTIGNVQPQVFKVSEIIPVADARAKCSFLTGLTASSSVCADDASYVNAVLSGATVANPIEIFFDVSIAIGSPIMAPVPSTVVLEGISSQSTGVFVLAGSNATAICNAYPSHLTGCGGGTDGFTPTPSTQGSLSIRHLGINGHRGTYPTGNANAGGSASCTNWCLGISVANLKYYEADDVYVYDAPTYAFLSANIDRQVYRNIRVAAPSSAINTDGIHIDGPCGTFLIDGATLQTGDNAIGLNIVEGYGGNCGGGVISNVNLNVINSSGILTYQKIGSTGYTLGPLVVSHVTGIVQEGDFMQIGLTGAASIDEVQSVKVSDVQILTTFGGFFNVGEDIGELNCVNCTWLPGNAAPEFIRWAGIGSPGTTVDNLTLTNTSIYRPDSCCIATAFWGVVKSGATITRFECNGCAVVNNTGSTAAALGYALDVQSGGAITNFVMTAWDPKLNPTLLNGNEWSRIANFSGAGVSTYYRNTTYANLPPATYPGLKASISDSNAGGVWGMSEGGGSPGHYAEETSNGTNWTVTGK